MNHVISSGIGEIDPAATQYMVRMRDGVRLATDVYLPSGDDTPGPVLLTRLPYDKNGAFIPTTQCAEYLMERGYRVVILDVRGKFRSEGALRSSAPRLRTAMTRLSGSHSSRGATATWRCGGHRTSV